MPTTTDRPTLTPTQRRRVARFVEALRSGKYKQGRDRLRTGDKFCCLGVACDLAKRSLKLNWEFSGWADEGQLFDSAKTSLPESVRRYYGFEDTDPILSADESAAILNDSGKRFKTLARLFEKKYLGGKEK
jgi:hypothetical protein